MGNCPNAKLFLGIKDDRLYVSVKFNDLETGQNIGTIAFNHWKVFLPNLLSYRYDDERLEVRDRQDNIVFSIKYEESNNGKAPKIVIGTYLNSEESVLVCTNTWNATCVNKKEKGWKKRALKFIETIESVF